MLLLKKFASDLGIPFLETSARDSLNIQEAFKNLAAEIKKDFVVDLKDGTVDIQNIQTVATTGYCCSYF